MDAAVDVLHGMIHNLVGVVGSQALIGQQCIGVQSRARLYMLLDLSL